MKLLNKRYSAIIQSLGFNDFCNEYYCINQVREDNSVASFKPSDDRTYSINTLNKSLSANKIKANFIKAPEVFDAVIFIEGHLGVTIDLIPRLINDERRYEIQVNFNSSLPGNFTSMTYEATYNNKLDSYEFAVTSILEIANDFKWANYL